MFNQIEEHFAASARTPKGQRAMRAIFKATRTTLSKQGLEGTSLDVIADRAGLTQAALRHYFPTRDELLLSFFTAATAWFQWRMTEVLSGTDLSPREVLEGCVGWHLEFMENVETSFWLDGSSYWLRHRPARRVRDGWYTWVTGRYAGLIGRMQPSLGPRECERRAYGILTLTLGAWVTHGRGSAVYTKVSVAERRQLLIDMAVEIATQ